MAATDFLTGELNGPAGKGARDALAHRSDHRRVGYDRSRHQAEPLARADRLDMLDYEVEPAGLATADCKQDEPEQEPQPVQCFAFHDVQFSLRSAPAISPALRILRY